MGASAVVNPSGSARCRGLERRCPRSGLVGSPVGTPLPTAGRCRRSSSPWTPRRSSGRPSGGGGAGTATPTAGRSGPSRLISTPTTRGPHEAGFVGIPTKPAVEGATIALRAPLALAAVQSRKLDGRRVGGAPRSWLRGVSVGFPRFKRKGRDPDRCTFSTGPLRIEPDRRHVTLPRIGTVRTCENTRRLERLVRLGRARILAATLKRVGERAIVVFRVEIQRPQRGHPDPASTVGVDVGVRWLVTVATADGMIERVPNPAPLARNLTVLRRLSRSISRRQRGSNRCQRKERRRAKL